MNVEKRRTCNMVILYKMIHFQTLVTTFQTLSQNPLSIKTREEPLRSVFSFLIKAYRGKPLEVGR